MNCRFLGLRVCRTVFKEAGVGFILIPQKGLEGIFEILVTFIILRFLSKLFIFFPLMYQNYHDNYDDTKSPVHFFLPYTYFVSFHMKERKH